MCRENNRNSIPSSYADTAITKQKQLLSVNEF